MFEVLESFEVPEVFEVVEAAEVMRCVLLCLLEDWRCRRRPTACCSAC